MLPFLLKSTGNGRAGSVHWEGNGVWSNAAFISVYGRRGNFTELGEGPGQCRPCGAFY